MKSLREPYRCKHQEFWHRQIGYISSKAYAHRIGGCQELIERLQLYGKLDGHAGCVNTVHFNPSGESLLSGSDDRRIVFWDWAAKRSRLSYCSGHDSNVFQAKVMPFSDDHTVVSCAADGQVRHAQIREDGTVQTKKLAEHQGRAHKLAIEPGSPRLFYTCGEDGVVKHFDLRSNRSTDLFSCLNPVAGSNHWRRHAIVRLNAIVINPRNPHYFAVGGSDEFARVYDVRKSCINASGTGDHPFDTFTPSHLIGSDQVHITCVAYSLQEELLASYNDEHIYLFDKDMGYGPDPKAASSEGANASRKEPQVYQGHRNAQTVKGVNFFGPNTEYVVSGSDCGRIFIWKKAGGQLVSLMVGDEQVVNCLEPHPYATVLATSGMDKDVKIWAPTAESRLPLPPDAEEVDVDKLKLIGYTLLSVNKEMDEEEKALYSKLYEELEETDRCISRTRRARTKKRIAAGTRASTMHQEASSDSITYTRCGSSSGRGTDHDHEALLQRLEEIEAEEDDEEEVREPEYDSDGNLIDEGDFILDSETDEGESSEANLASDHPSDEEEVLPFAP